MTLETTGKRTLGKQIELLSGEEPVAIEYSKDNKKIYWINIEDKSLRSANLDGSGKFQCLFFCLYTNK